MIAARESIPYHKSVKPCTMYMPAKERGSASLSIVNRLDENSEEIFGDGRLKFDGNTIDA